VVHEIAYQYGKNVGIAFQLIDDVLDFTSCSDQMGKPTSADLKLGLATGPVLFACQQVTFSKLPLTQCLVSSGHSGREGSDKEGVGKHLHKRPQISI